MTSLNFLWVLLLVLGGGCDQSVDDGSDSGTGSDAVVADSGPGTDGVSPDLGAADGASADLAAGDAAAPVTVKVTYGGQDKTVDLSQATPVTFEGHPSAKLAEVVGLAFPNTDQSGLVADFVAGDGFNPATKSNCSGLLPVDGSDLAKGYVDLATRNLRWDTALQFPGCLYVDDLGEIQLADK